VKTAKPPAETFFFL